jgi:adenine-specific DNA-methyltransferase
MALVYPGKATASAVLATPPAVLSQVFEGHNGGHLDSVFGGDNLSILLALLPEFRNKVDLIYIDPPYATGRDFADLDGLLHYDDRATGFDYVEGLRRRLIVLHSLLSPEGTLYLHLDQRMGHYARVILDEVFGPTNFISEIARVKCSPKQIARKAFGNMKDVIYVYAKDSKKHIFNDIREPLTEEQTVRQFPIVRPDGRRAATVPIHAPGVTNGGQTPWRDRLPPTGAHWQYKIEALEEFDRRGLISWSSTGNPRRFIFADEHFGNKVQDIWTDFKDKGARFSSYPTEKNHKMLELIIRTSSNEGSIVLDAYSGSGSTLFTAARLGRHFIGMDVGPEAVETISNNLTERSVMYNLWESDYAESAEIREAA